MFDLQYYNLLKNGTDGIDDALLTQIHPVFTSIKLNPLDTNKKDIWIKLIKRLYHKRGTAKISKNTSNKKKHCTKFYFDLNRIIEKFQYGKYSFCGVNG